MSGEGSCLFMYHVFTVIPKNFDNLILVNKKLLFFEQLFYFF
ncbi:hypothetical protein CCAN2_30019 [Capnocytophaga canimorsus]|nr:hypothetical protein CCAN2_30019 [Capnocytophaga canimorsus]